MSSLKGSMTNSTVVSTIRLTAYLDVGHWKPVCVLVLVVLYALIVASNVLLICAVVSCRALHRPMYTFLCVLCLNELYGASCMVPFVLVQLGSATHAVSTTFCYLQVFQIYTYVSVEFTALAVISYDRYVAVCLPLHYGVRMSPGKVRLLIIVVWLPPLVAVGVTTVLTASLSLCADKIDKVYCDNYSIVKMSCSDVTLNNWYELVAAGVTVICPVTVIVFTYLQIVRVCVGCKRTRQKALTTCTPHLCSLLNFTFGISFEVMQTRFNTSHWPRVMNAIQPFYLLLCQPLFNPLMYGLNLTALRHAAKSLLCTACKNLLSKTNKLTV